MLHLVRHLSLGWKKDRISQPTTIPNTNGKGFNDITEGSNPGGLFCDGFKATQRWGPGTSFSDLLIGRTTPIFKISMFYPVYSITI